MHTPKPTPRLLLRSTMAAVVLATLAVPAAFAAGPYDGTIVVDPTFESGGVLPTQAPRHHARQAAPAITPPPTDTAVGSSSSSTTGDAAPASVLVLAAIGIGALAVTRPAMARRSHRRA